MRADKGTPEFQAKKDQGQLKRGGVEYLFERGVIDQNQCSMGRMYAGWCAAFHSKHNITCSLSRLVVSEGEMPERVENRLVDVMAAEDWFAKVSNELRRRALRDKIPYARIVLMVCVYGWNCADVQLDVKKRESTARNWLRKSFIELVDVVEMFRDQHERTQDVDIGRGKTYNSPTVDN